MTLKKTYILNFVKIYIWQSISIILGFISLFIVIPYISSNQTIYGIYSICISISLFLSYADLGFLSSGHKYSSEFYAKQDIENEQRIMAFTSFIMFCFIILLSLIFIFFSFFPERLIANLNYEEINIASNLLLTLALFSPFTVLQRISQVIFSIRLEDYKYQIINIIGNLIKILSVLFFFRKNHYDIVNYYIFIQIINVLCSLIAFMYITKYYKYNILFLLKNIKFNLESYKQTRGLAFNSIVLTISWILYYECDSFIIGKYIGAKEVAIFSIGIAIMSFFRTFLGTFFAPFNSRFNHFIGLKDIGSLRNTYKSIILIAFPLILFSITTVLMLMNPLILSWVGFRYKDSISIACFLICCNMFAFVSYPTGVLLNSLKLTKILYVTAIFMPIFYWIGIALTFRFLGIKSFAIFKFIMFFIVAIYYTLICIKFLKIKMTSFIKEILVPNIYAFIILIIILSLNKLILKIEFSKLALFQTIIYGIISFIVSMIIVTYTNPIYIKYRKNIFSLIILKINLKK